MVNRIGKTKTRTKKNIRSKNKTIKKERKTKKTNMSKQVLFIIVLMSEMLPHIKKGKFLKKHRKNKGGGESEANGKNEEEEIASTAKTYEEIQDQIKNYEIRNIKNPELKQKIEELQKCADSFAGFKKFLGKLYDFGKILDNPRKFYESLLEYFDRQESSEIVVRVYKSLLNNPNRYDYNSTKVFLNKDANIFTDALEAENLIKSIKNSLDGIVDRDIVTERKIKITRNPRKREQIDAFEKQTKKSLEENNEQI
jgi:hypothetical protein